MIVTASSRPSEGTIVTYETATVAARVEGSAVCTANSAHAARRRAGAVTQHPPYTPDEAPLSPHRPRPSSGGMAFNAPPKPSYPPMHDNTTELHPVRAITEKLHLLRSRPPAPRAARPQTVARGSGGRGRGGSRYSYAAGPPLATLSYQTNSRGKVPRMPSLQSCTGRDPAAPGKPRRRNECDAPVAQRRTKTPRAATPKSREKDDLVQEPTAVDGAESRVSDVDKEKSDAENLEDRFLEWYIAGLHETSGVKKRVRRKIERERQEEGGVDG